MASNLWIGRELGNYVVRSLLGEGGMGAVFVGEHRFLGQRVAIKVLHGTYAHNPTVSQRFFQEAKASLEIGHPNIIRVLDFGQSNEGALYLVMELLEGGSLAQSVEQHGVFDEATTARIGVEIARGLKASHDKGIVHRDLKPDNVFLTTNDEVKILDFGIAKVASSAGGTKSGAILGTPQYMAPEQARGAQLVGPQTDVYALGSILFFMLTGRPPFLGQELAELITKALMDEPPRPSELVTLSPQMEALILQCLAKDPPARPAGMAEVLTRLGEIQGRVSPTAQPRPATLNRPPISRSTLSSAAGQVASASAAAPRRRVGLVVGAATLGVAALVFVGTRVRRDRSPANATPVPAPVVAAAVAPPPAKPSPPARSKVVLRSEPPGATILVDGKASGTTPAVLDLELPQAVVLEHEGYAPRQEVLTREGEASFTLTALPKKTGHATRPARPHSTTPRETGGGLD